MERKIKKSVVATGLAATTIISGSLSHQVNAEEVKTQSTEPKTSEKITKPVTETDVQSAKMQADAAKVQTDAQQKVVEQVKGDVNTSKDAVADSEKAVANAEAEKKEATPEVIETAKEEVATSEKAVTTEENKVQEAEQSETKAKEAVKNQENVVAGQQSLVDVAQRELDTAKAPVANEQQELNQAQDAEKQAEKDLAEKQKELAKVKEEIANLPKEINSATEQVKQSEQKVAENQAAIDQKASEVARAEQSAANRRNVDLSKATYGEFLQHAKTNGANQAIRNAAAEALTTYERAKREDGITVGSDATSPATLENNLKAIELVRAINAYRRQAGLKELLIDPYKNPASQVQTLYFERADWHMGKYLRNENVAISFTPKGAVDFWHKEKSIYMAEAAKYGLTTNERDIDSNQIYTTLRNRGQLAFFYRVGHYLQMMDKNFNTISAAYDQVPNQYSNIYGTSEVGFYNDHNFNARVNNGTLLSADAYEQAIRNFAGAAKAANAQATAAKKQLGVLRAQRTGYVSTLNIQKAKLAELQKLAANRSATLATANAGVITAEAALKKAKQNVAVKQAALERATVAIASKLAPKQVALEKAQKVLDSAKNKLAELKKVLITAELNVAKTKDALRTSQAKLKEAQDNLEKLQNAPQALEAAQKALQAAQADYASKVKTLKDEEAKLEISRSIYTKLQENYEQLKSQLPPKAQKETDGEVQKLHLSRTYQPKPLLVRQQNTGQKVLPATGTKADQVAALGLLLGLGTLASARRRKRNNED
ncbi:LPXTG cell wall anchor domain-containing protein [Streptococcus anginosus]|uniref:CAP domain-containing protein n=1 Tax=Streptococcus anginosus TaxID=1328 RepID=A0ABD4TZ68_STRAP|nr:MULTISPECIES: CAP domain-containing protein [Streptococcus]MCW1075662.1 CAP domain-containing protein [Streptococcus anginosus]MDB8655185.1 CAP domain-containing protein [Streptococcus anginosus]MDB8658694.1 CAP domain-containing protein [Streptococcus anginosus]MDB8665218.1 CAP domain-containing protein [Streptococcus anginosus]OFL61948.1 peptidase [Streptococcus sp. HMSC057E02]